MSISAALAQGLGFLTTTMTAASSGKAAHRHITNTICNQSALSSKFATTSEQSVKATAPRGIRLTSASH
jgi:hypothetical protein